MMTSTSQLPCGRQGQNDVGDGRAVRRALVSFVGQGFKPVARKNAAFDATNLVTLISEFFLEDSPLNPAVNNTD